MPAPSAEQQKLLALLRELFQLDQPDLDFGLYRIMHAKSREIEQFIDNDLLGIISDTFSGNQADLIAQAKAAYERERQNALDYGGNPDSSPKVQQALAEYRVAQESQGEDAELYDHLYRFFERYYDGGDFLARRYYARATDSRAEAYAVPYDGSEVYLHWANKDQYYIKTAENFRQYSVNLAEAEAKAKAKAGDTDLLASDTPMPLHFTVVEAEEGAHNNVKGGERYFIVDSEQPLEWSDGALTVRFHYTTDPEKAGQAGKWREARNAKNEAAILAAMQADSSQQAAEYAAALATEIPKGRDGTQTLLAKYLNQYTAKNSMDYFIHKNLGGFLKRELDFYIKNELFRLDDLGTHHAPNLQQYDKLLKKALTLRTVAHKLVEFLAQTEDFQKKLWLKKKFVMDTHWLVTLDKVPTSLYPSIQTNDQQWAEWERLGFVTADADRATQLTADSKLVLDSSLFDADFTATLLDRISANSGNLDDATDGVLVHSENFQALNLMQARYREQVKCIYIDPPYNTSASEISYKNSYKHSSWLALMQDRVLLGKSLMNDEAVISVAIDDAEFSRLHVLLIEIFGEENNLATVAVRAKPQGRAMAVGFSPNHEYADFFSKSSSAKVGRLPRNEERLARYSESDDEGIFAWSNLRATGANSYRSDRPKLFYPIWINPQTSEITIPSFVWDESVGVWRPTTPPLLELLPIYPIDNDDEERVWAIGWERAQKLADSDLLARESNGKWQVQRKYRPNQDGVLPGTWWAESKYSASESGTKVLQDILGDAGEFSYPKSIFTVEDCIRSSGIGKSDCTLDFFGGSATTGHAVINLNREDNGKRKYLLVEMGDYFDAVTKPRIAKVIYSADWKDGKPTAPESGVSQLVKVVRLESYEDTLNNLHINDAPAGQVATTVAALRENYFLYYLLALETQGSPSLLNVAQFADPTAYTLNVKKPGSEAQEARVVDLVETFNWLLGLRVHRLQPPQTFDASFADERDVELPADAGTRTIVQGISASSTTAGGYWFRTVQGEAPEANGRLARVWVVWRKLTGDPVRDNLVLEAYLREVLHFDVRHTAETDPQIMYVNGSHALPVLAHCEVRQLETAFHHLMWDVQDA